LINQVTGKENIFENSPFDDSTRAILGKSDASVGILVDKNFNKMDRVFIPILDENDISLIRFAQKMIKNSGAQITVIDAGGEIKNNSEIKELIRTIEQFAPNHIHLMKERIIDKEFLKLNDLMVVSAGSWKKLIETKSVWLSDIPSVLILSEKN
jgi:hypothetical protein